MSFKAAEAAWEAAHVAARQADIAVKAAELVPKPDPREDVNYKRLAGVEENMLARLSPRHKNRWPKLLEFEEKLVEFDRRQANLIAELSELHTRRKSSDERHAQALDLTHEVAFADAVPVASEEYAALLEVAGDCRLLAERLNELGEEIESSARRLRAEYRDAQRLQDAS